MSEKKLSSDEVPQKFAEWLLFMGCPAQEVPALDKLAEMCRGQYYMVWRSLMEQVEPKSKIRYKRLQVFCNDIRRSKDKNAFNKLNSSVVVPEELLLWKQQTELTQKLADTEAEVLQTKQDCNLLMDKVSSKLSHRNLARGQLENIQRRTWLLQRVSEELSNKKTNLIETRSIAECLCSFKEDVDIENKLTTQINKSTSNRRQNIRVPSTSLSGNTLHSSVTSSNGDHNDSEEYLSLVKCSGEALWPLLCERRASLNAALNINKTLDTNLGNNRVTPRYILTQNAALTCTLGLAAYKNKEHIENTRRTLGEEIAQLNDYLSLSEESRELLVLRCEEACGRARINTLRALINDVTEKNGAFAAEPQDICQKNSLKQISVIDKIIETKRDELKKVITSLCITERKIHKVRECLINVFNSFHSDEYLFNEKLGGQLSMPQESIITLRRFYEEKRDKRRHEMDLRLDISDNRSCNISIANGNPTYTDELKTYLNTFNLDNNKKIILESGEKVWIFETVQSSIYRLHKKLQDNNLICPLVCPSASLISNLQRIHQLLERKEDLSVILSELEGRQKNDIVVIDISSQKEEEDLITDKIKKSLNENIQNLHKTNKRLELAQENLNIWAENRIKQYISPRRTIDDRTYTEYESCYLRNVKY